MRYFFFGSLMDTDILALVVGRPVPPSMVRAASLHGYQRFRVRGESFPMLQPTPGGRVEGILVDGLDEADAIRIAWFEDQDYCIHETDVVDADGTVVTAWVCLPTERLAHDGEVWELPLWQRLEKPDFHLLTTEWMALHGRLAEAELEDAWAALKARLLSRTQPPLRERRAAGRA